MIVAWTRLRQLIDLGEDYVLVVARRAR